MKQNLSILICDEDHFYAAGLLAFISDWAASREMHARFADQFQLRARSEFIFVSQNELTPYRLHTLRMEMPTPQRYVFIIQPQRNPVSEGMMPLPENCVVISRQAEPSAIKQCLDNALRKIASAPVDSTQHHSETVSICSPLTFRETQILRFLARGISHATVARYLKISEKTVSTHKRNIMTKLNISRTTELNYWLIDEGFFRPPPSFTTPVRCEQ